MSTQTAELMSILTSETHLQHVEDVRALANRNLWGCARSRHALWKQYSRILIHVSTLLATRPIEASTHVSTIEATLLILLNRSTSLVADKVIF
jgi:hypothetical protein